MEILSPEVKPSTTPPPKTPFLAMVMHPGPHTACSDPVNPLRVTWSLVMASPPIGSEETISVNAKAAGHWFPVVTLHGAEVVSPTVTVAVFLWLYSLRKSCEWQWYRLAQRLRLFRPRFHFCNGGAIGSTHGENGVRKSLSKEQRYSKWFD